MIDIFVTIFAGVVFVIIWMISTYLMIFLMHPYEKRVATFSKIIVVLSMSLAYANVLMLPLDVAQKASADVHGGIPMDSLWLAVYLLIVLLCVLILPFAVAYYEGDDVDGDTSQCGEGVKWSLIFFIIFAALFLVGYFFIGFSDVPVMDMQAPFVDGDDPISLLPCTASTCGVTLTPSIMTFKSSFIIFMVATLSVFGWILLVFFGGIGLVALPVDLVNAFRYRPIPIDPKEYKASKIKIGEQSEKLLEVADEWKEKKPSRKEKNQWKQKVYSLEQQYVFNEIAFKKKGGVVIVYYFKLVAGILGILLTILWLVQIIGWYNMQLLFPTYVPYEGYPLLNLMFVEFDAFLAFFGVIIFGILAFWLMACVIKGNFKWGIRVPFLITIHPMKKNATMLNSMLVNTSLILVTSVAVTHLCAGSFSVYVRQTAVNTIFNVVIRYLRGLYVYWIVVSWLLIAFVVLAAIYFVFKPVDDDVKLLMEAHANHKRKK